MDQAERLRKIMENKKKKKDKCSFRVITVSSGKGGVGKTNFVGNLAVVLQKRGFKVAILDGDLGMANVNILFGINTRHSVYDLLYEGKSIDEIIISTNDGIKIIPGGSGILELTEIDELKRERLLEEFSKIKDIDILLIDNSAGVSKLMLNLIEIADDLIVITNPEPTSITDAYSLIKVIINQGINKKISIVINRAKDILEARETYEKISKAVNFFLNKEISYLGFISEDSKVRKAVKEQQPFISIYPKSEASICLNGIASNLIGENVESKNLSFKDYINKLVRIMGR